MFFLKILPDEASIIRFTGCTDQATKVSRSLQRMRSASLLIRQVDHYFAAHELSQLKFLILIVIEREPERTNLRASEIASRLDVSKPVLHRTIQALLADALLMAEKDPQDRRAELLALTDIGRAKLTATLPGYFDLMAGHEWGDF